MLAVACEHCGLSRAEVWTENVWPPHGPNVNPRERICCEVVLPVELHPDTRFVLTLETANMLAAALRVFQEIRKADGGEYFLASVRREHFDELEGTPEAELSDDGINELIDAIYNGATL